MTKKIGILGGGQLGRMIIQNAISFPEKIAILDPDDDAPAKNIVHQFVLGDFRNEQTVLDFGKNFEVIGIEIEDVNVEALKKLQKEGKTIIPTPEIIEIIQDKGLQKKFFTENNLPTSPYFLVRNKEELLSKINPSESPFPLKSFVQKLRTGGYDGKGVQVINEKNPIENSWDAPSVIEELVEIKKELAVLFVKKNQEIRLYPTTEMVFDDRLNLVDFVFSPANITAEIDNEIQIIIHKIADAIHSDGIFAVEMFLTYEDKIIINEIAPRVHNSGHHTIEANYSSQFDQYFRLLADYPLGNTALRSCAAMINIIGKENYVGEPIFDFLTPIIDLQNTYIHLYGKKVSKPGRKLGHITVVADTNEAVLEKIIKIKEILA